MGKFSGAKGVKYKAGEIHLKYDAEYNEYLMYVKITVIPLTSGSVSSDAILVKLREFSLLSSFDPTA